MSKTSKSSNAQKTGSTPSKTKAHCNECLRNTNHIVVAVNEQSDHEEYEGQIAYWWTVENEMLQCCGCDTVSLRVTTKESNLPEPSIVYYPPRVSRKWPHWLKALDFFWNHDTLWSLLREIYGALHSGSNSLALMGARSVIDYIMNDKLGDVGGFKEKLKRMEVGGWISSAHCKVIETAVEAGHATVHRNHRPDAKTVNEVMDIVESLIQSIYVLDKTAAKLAKSIPRRNASKAITKKDDKE